MNPWPRPRVAIAVRPILPALLVLLGGAAAHGATPTDADVARHAAALAHKLAGRGFTVLAEPPFVLVGDEGAERLRQRAQTVRWTRRLLLNDYFSADPERVLEVWLFRDRQTYRRGARAIFGDDPDTPYGYYSAEHGALIMNIGGGAGDRVVGPDGAPLLSDLARRVRPLDAPETGAREPRAQLGSVHDR